MRTIEYDKSELALSADRELTTDEVASFLNRRATRYLETLERLRSLLIGLRMGEVGSSAIYGVYSRGDRQRGGHEFKEPWQVKEKVNLSRRKGNSTTVPDIGDIIGLTVVCAYDDSLDTVRDPVISSSDGEDAMLLPIAKGDIEDKRQEPPPSKRNAVHMTVLLTAPELRLVRCEIQLKTLLQDAWDFWSHDLTYQRRGVVGKQASTNIEGLKGLLHSTEESARKTARLLESSWEFYDIYRAEVRDELPRGLRPPVII